MGPTIAAGGCVIDTLTTVEENRLEELESVVRRGLGSFLEVGAALAEIRDSRLYRRSYGTFADYLQRRWNMGLSHAYRLIDASETVRGMEALSPRGESLLPVSEKQVRPLTALPEPESQAAVWNQAVEEAGGAQPTGVSVAAIAARVLADLDPDEQLQVIEGEEKRVLAEEERREQKDDAAARLAKMWRHVEGLDKLCRQLGTRGAGLARALGVVREELEGLKSP